MTGAEYRDALARLGLSQVGAARFLGIDDRTSRRWALGEVSIPVSVHILLELMIRVRLSPDRVEELVWSRHPR
jgi:hypothetical protein